MKSLTFYWRSALAVMVATALTTAVLTGALMVGDSLKASLQRRGLNRLDAVHMSLVRESFFPATLAQRLAVNEPSVRPVISVNGSAAHGSNGTNAGSVSILGLAPDTFETFDQLMEGAGDGLIAPVVINRSFASELGAEVGDQLSLTFAQVDQVAREFLFGERELDAFLTTLRCKVIAVESDDGWAGFNPNNPTASHSNVFLPLSRLQRELNAQEQINGMLAIAERSNDDWTSLLSQSLTASDLGLIARRVAGGVQLEHQAFVLPPPLEPWLDAVTADRPQLRYLTYMANRMEASGKAVPYSAISAFSFQHQDPMISMASGSPFDDQVADAIWINQWLADQLELEVGSEITMSYFSPDSATYETESRGFRVAGIAKMDGLAADRTLSPIVPGMNDASDMRSWDAPFPLQLRSIRPVDEAYWDEFGPAPKALIGLPKGRELWASRFGNLTGVRLTTDQPELVEALLHQPHSALDPEALGFFWRNLRAEIRIASQGNTDFGQLFAAFSFFIVISALMLTAMFFRTGLESRVREIGILHAMGYRRRTLVLRYLKETAPVSLVGVLVGACLATLYTHGVVALMREVWFVHYEMDFLRATTSIPTLVGGAMTTWVLTLLVVTVSLWRLLKAAPRTLIMGNGSTWIATGKRTLLWAVGAIAGGLVLTLFGLLGDAIRPGMFFAAGSLVLVGGITGFVAWVKRVRSHDTSMLNANAMALRNCSRQSGRNTLAMALVSSAVFILAAVGANKKGEPSQIDDRHAGSGGYALIAQSSQPVIGDLNDADTFASLGGSNKDLKAIGPVYFSGLRWVDGEDASCLNLYQPKTPNLIAAVKPSDFVGRFHFSGLLLPEYASSPWDALNHQFEDGAIPVIGDANTVKWILHSGLGRDLEVESEAGATLKLRFVGLIAHSIFQSELIMAPEQMLRHFPHRSSQRMFLAECPEPQADRLLALLESQLTDIGFDAQLSAQRLGSYQAIENTYMSIFQALGGLGLLLGSLGLAVVMFRNIIERRSELAMLHAMGFSEKRITKLLAMESRVVILAGILTGLVAAWCASIPVLMERGVGSIAAVLWLCVGVFTMGLLSSRWAIHLALRTPIIQALRAQ